MSKRKNLRSPGKSVGMGLQDHLDLKIKQRKNPFNKVFKKLPKGHPSLPIKPGKKTPRGRIV